MANPTFQLTLPLSGQTLHREQIQRGEWSGKLTDYEEKTLVFCQEWLSGKTAFVLHTSGSTGTPKPIELKRQQLAASARMTGKALGLLVGDRALVNLNTAYIAGVMMLVRGMELGLHLTLIEPQSLPLSIFPPETRFELLSFVPLQLQNALQQEDKQEILQAAKAIIVGGAPVTEGLESQLQKLKAPIFQTYGMTETVSHIALRRLNGPEKADYYSVLEGVSIAADSRNCLMIEAPALSEQPVVTNDVVEILSPTAFRWLGRADNMINTGGVKVQAEKVEQAVGTILRDLQVERRFLVVGLPHPQFGEAVTLFIEGTPLEPPAEALLREQLSQLLFRYEVPKTIHFLPAFPETPTGKIDRQAIAGKFR